jgi:hypothetical protein
VCSSDLELDPGITGVGIETVGGVGRVCFWSGDVVFLSSVLPPDALIEAGDCPLALICVVAARATSNILFFIIFLLFVENCILYFYCTKR